MTHADSQRCSDPMCYEGRTARRVEKEISHQMTHWQINCEKGVLYLIFFFFFFFFYSPDGYGITFTFSNSSLKHMGISQQPLDFIRLAFCRLW